MIGVVAALVAAATATAASAAPDLAWVIDGDIPQAISAANAEAHRADVLAAESEASAKTMAAKQQAALTEKENLAKGLEALSRSKRSEAEKRIATLTADADYAGTRVKELQAEASSHRARAKAQRALAKSLEAEGKARREDAAKHTAPEDLGDLSDARLGEITAFYKRRLARVPKQLAALDAQLEREVGISDRGAVVSRKEAVRSAAAADEAEVRRIADELGYRSDTKADEAIAAAQLEAAARAKAQENATPSPISSVHSDHVDAALDRILEKQDQEAAAKAQSAKTTRTFVRLAIAAGGIGTLAVILVMVLKRS